MRWCDSKSFMSVVRRAEGRNSFGAGTEQVQKKGWCETWREGDRAKGRAVWDRWGRRNYKERTTLQYVLWRSHLHDATVLWYFFDWKSFLINYHMHKKRWWQIVYRCDIASNATSQFQILEISTSQIPFIFYSSLLNSPNVTFHAFTNTYMQWYFHICSLACSLGLWQCPIFL